MHAATPTRHPTTTARRIVTLGSNEVCDQAAPAQHS